MLTLGALGRPTDAPRGGGLITLEGTDSASAPEVLLLAP